MNHIPDDDKTMILALKEEIREAVNTIEFLHKCLTVDGYGYGYPEQTVETIKWLNKVAPPIQGCYHSINVAGCKKCEAGNEARRLHEWLKRKFWHPDMAEVHFLRTAEELSGHGARE